VTPVSIFLDDLEITSHVLLTIDKNIGFAADEFQFEIENSEERYTDLFYGTAGDKLGIKIQGALTFSGQVDSVSFSVHSPESIRVRGRDHTGRLCDSLVTAALTAKFKGKTDSQIVKLIATDQSYPTDLTDTTKVHSEESLPPVGASLWYVIVELAQRNGFDAWVGPDKTLHFRKRELSSDPKRVYDLARLRSSTLPFPLSTLSFDQDKLLSRGLKVLVIGYDPKTGKGHRVEKKTNPLIPEATSKSSNPLLPGSPGRDTQQGRRPGEIQYTAESSQRNSANYQLVVVKDYSLDTKEKVLARAEALLREYSAGLITGALTVPGDSDLEINDCIQITGSKIADLTGGKYYVIGLHHDHSVNRFATTITFASKVLTENIISTESVL
jgi:phage protein D